jgi:hypothetical protein
VDGVAARGMFARRQSGAVSLFDRSEQAAYADLCALLAVYWQDALDEWRAWDDLRALEKRRPFLDLELNSRAPHETAFHDHHASSSLLSSALEPVGDFAALIHDKRIFSLEQAHIFNRIFPGVGQWFIGGDVAHQYVTKEILDAIGQALVPPVLWRL